MLDLRGCKQRERRNALREPTEVLQAAMNLSLAPTSYQLGSIHRETSNDGREGDYQSPRSSGCSTFLSTDQQKLLVKGIYFEPAPILQRIQCRVHRIYREDRLFPHYELHLEGIATSGRNTSFLLAAQRKRTLVGTKYVISTHQIESEKFNDGIVAKIKSNVGGTRFEIYDAKVLAGQEARCTKAVVLYDTNVLGLKGPRKMTILLPGMTEEGQIRALPYDSHKCRLHQKYLQQEKEKYPMGQLKPILALQNKSPHWNEETQSYVLNFNNRVSQASVKNFQVAPDFDCPDTFSMDFQYPLNAIQAFGIVLTEFDPKLFCE